MYPDILTEKQKELVPFFEPFSSEFYMVGGTAISLYIGHRKSIDFDLFTFGSIKPGTIRKWMDSLPFKPIDLIHEDGDQMHMVINDVRVTFFSFPYEIKCVEYIHALPLPSLLTLAAMKAFALGGRAKWKDYVDLYFIINNHYSLKVIIQEAENLFSGRFNGRLFRQQLSYFNDIDYSEAVEYLIDPVPEDRIKYFLSGVSTDSF